MIRFSNRKTANLVLVKILFPIRPIIAKSENLVYVIFPTKLRVVQGVQDGVKSEFARVNL